MKACLPSIEGHNHQMEQSLFLHRYHHNYQHCCQGLSKSIILMVQGSMKMIMREDSFPLLLLTKMFGKGHSIGSHPSHLAETLLLEKKELPPQAVGKIWCFRYNFSIRCKMSPTPCTFKFLHEAHHFSFRWNIALRETLLFLSFR